MEMWKSLLDLWGKICKNGLYGNEKRGFPQRYCAKANRRAEIGNKKILQKQTGILADRGVPGKIRLQKGRFYDNIRIQSYLP